MMVRLKGHPPLIDLPCAWHIPQHLLHVDVLVPATQLTGPDVSPASYCVSCTQGQEILERSYNAHYQHTHHRNMMRQCQGKVHVQALEDGRFSPRLLPK